MEAKAEREEESRKDAIRTEQQRLQRENDELKLQTHRQCHIASYSLRSEMKRQQESFDHMHRQLAEKSKVWKPRVGI